LEGGDDAAAIGIEVRRPLNDNVARVGSSRCLDLAKQWAAEEGWHPWNAARWIRGLAGELHRLDPRRDGFRAEDVVRVVQAWHGDDWEVWEGGFVVELRDGRTARLECFALLFDWSCPEESRVAASIEPKGYDERTANRWEPDHRHFEDGAALPELQAFLRRLAPIN